MTRDLTTGKPLPLLVSFTVPLALGTLFQQCFSVIDAALVGRCIGVGALAAVGATGSVNYLVIGLVTGVCAGMGIPISQSFGARDAAQLRRYVLNAAYICIGLSALLTLLCAVFTRPLLTLMHTPADIFADAYRYIMTVFYGVGGIVLYQMGACVIRALGDSRTPVFFLVLACVLNAGLDLLLILAFQMGVFGAALATVISQTLSGLACLWYILRKLSVLRPRPGEAAPSLRHIGKLLGQGLPMGLQCSITAIGGVVLQRAVNELGSQVVGAVTAANKVNGFFTCTLASLGTAVATYVGQNLGAGRLDRVRTGVHWSLALGTGYGVLAFVVLRLFGGSLAGLFVDAGDAEVIRLAATFLQWTSLFFVLLNAVFVYRFGLQGLGHSGLAMFAGVTEMLARIAVAFALVSTVGFLGVCLADPAAWLAADLFLVPMFCLKLSRTVKQRDAAMRRDDPAQRNDVAQPDAAQHNGGTQQCDAAQQTAAVLPGEQRGGA